MVLLIIFKCEIYHEDKKYELFNLKDLILKLLKVDIVNKQKKIRRNRILTCLIIV